MSGAVTPEGSAGTHREPFGARLGRAMAELGPLCVGVDPHPGLLAAWGLPDTAAGVREFALRTADAVAGTAAACKPQSALFERHGSAGVAVLEELLAACRERGLLTVLDAKRGDIGSTMTGYAQAYLADGSPLAADAVTLSPYLGFGSLAPAVDLARATGRGVFVLCLTSNPEGAEVQHARRDGTSVAASVAAQAGRVNAGALADGGVLGPVGLVVGATIGDSARAAGVDLAAVRGALLAPGIGAQGAGPEDLRAVFGPALPQVLATASRSVLGAGPDAQAVRAAARGLAEALRRAVAG